MGDEGREVSLRLLLKFCFEQEAQERMESYLSPQELKELYPDMTALDQKVADGIDALQKEEKRQQHRPLRVLKRTLLVAAVLISIFSCIMLTSAAVRSAIANTVIDWTGYWYPICNRRRAAFCFARWLWTTLYSGWV